MATKKKAAKKAAVKKKKAPAKKAAVKKKAPVAKAAKKVSNKSNAKSEPAFAEASDKKNAMVDDVLVRMYCIGTGDCFLLLFRSKGKVVFKMLVDCGSCSATAEEFAPYVNNIADVTGGHIDVLMITHEHLDHIIGFAKAYELFKKRLTFENVWLAWTEDKSYGPAKAVKKEIGKGNQAMAIALQRFKEIDSRNARADSANGVDLGLSQVVAGRRRFQQGLKEILGLTYDGGEMLAAAGGGTGAQMDKAMKYVTTEVLAHNGKKPTYCYPGKPIDPLPAVKGVNFYVLGPPEDIALLRKAEIKAHLYEENAKELKDQLAVNDPDFFYNALGIDTDGKYARAPFASKYLDKENVQHNQYEQERWRTIDSDWLYAAGSMGLRAGNLTNNTSLVIAIELEGRNRVLLLAADAQSGNWVSWTQPEKEGGTLPKLRWRVKRSTTTETVTAATLLQNTVFYKVGHHSSHNATASDVGLELMTHEDLVAFAPLDRTRINSTWKTTMPTASLNKRLIEKTSGRYVRMDLDNLAVTNVKPDNPVDKKTVAQAKAAFGKLTSAQQKDFLANYSAHPDGLYKQFIVKA